VPDKLCGLLLKPITAEPEVPVLEPVDPGVTVPPEVPDGVTADPVPFSACRVNCRLRLVTSAL
jgi:hypothetical protein